MDESRIPGIHGNSFKAMHKWFGEMYEKGFLFHPDDPAESIIVIKTSLPMITEDESQTLTQIIDSMFTRFGDRVYEAAYPYFMKAMGYPEN